jgi:hypothetical protein
MTSQTKIKCPKCGKSFEPSEAFKHEFQEQLAANIEKRYEKKLEEATNKARQEAEKQLRKEAEHQIKDLQNQLKSNSEKLDNMREAELKLREEKRKVEEEKKDLKLEVQRKLDAEREKIEKKAFEQADEQHHLKGLEKDKIISDLKKSLEEAQRKAHQGSQQLQGEVLELDFEQALKKDFPNDDIMPVGKGVKGADVRQIVKSPRGFVCGTILWETKRTKAWSDKWIQKLKDDLRAENANIAVIVTTTLPREMETGFGHKDGVWITGFFLAKQVALLLRKNLLDLGYQKAVAQNKGGKAEKLYEYITSHEFRQNVEASVESYLEMKIQLTKEKAALEKIWKRREKQIDRLFSSTANVVGSIQAEVGRSSFQIKGLDLLELDSGD